MRLSDLEVGSPANQQAFWIKGFRSMASSESHGVLASDFAKPSLEAI
jgi:hypothetical protein